MRIALSVPFSTSSLVHLVLAQASSIVGREPELTIQIHENCLNIDSMALCDNIELCALPND